MSQDEGQRMTDTLRDIEQELEDGPDREPPGASRGGRVLTCFCCGSRYRRGEWRCCRAPAGTTAAEWSDQWHRFEDDGRKRSHCPRHPCAECLAGGANAPGPRAVSSTVTPFDPEADEGGDWKERAAGDAERLEDEVGF